MASPKTASPGSAPTPARRATAKSEPRPTAKAEARPTKKATPRPVTERPAVAVQAVAAPHRPAVDLHLRHHAIAEAAYLAAERRGFVPGFELDDWLQAEAAYEARARHD